MLFGGDPRHRLEPVCIMGCTVFHRPVFHGIGNHIGNIDIEVGSAVDGFAKGLIDVLGELFSHNVVVKDKASKHFRHAAHSDSFPFVL